MAEVNNNIQVNRNDVPRRSFNNSGGQQGRQLRRDALRSKRSILKKRGTRNTRKTKPEETDFESRVVLVRRVTRVVKGGKRMRFSALVVVGDRNGKVGVGLMKGLDYQDAVAKATRKAKGNLINIQLNTDSSLNYPSITKHKSCVIYLKPAKSGTGIIAGGFLRPVLELAGIKNVYSKISRSRNKIAGTQAAILALSKYRLSTPSYV